MTTHLKRNFSIDLFNLPPIPDERNAMDSYLDVTNNFYIPDGKNSRLLQLTERKEFNRKTLDGNEGFVLEIPFLEGAFGTKSPTNPCTWPPSKRRCKSERRQKPGRRQFHRLDTPKTISVIPCMLLLSQP